MDLLNTGENLIVQEPEPYDQFALSREQILAGNEIIRCFIENPNDIRWAILLAQMQSGKTETYLFVCCELIRLLIIGTAVIFSGNTETDLRDQLKKEVDGTGNAKFYGKYDIFLDETLGIPTRVRREVLANVKTHIIVLWGTELNKHNTSYSNTLFIWEEAHHAQTINQCPDKFLKKIGISANGDVTTLRQKENFVISISATPFSEYSDYYHFGQHKKFVYMRPGNGYNSVKLIRETGRLKSFNSVETGLRTALSTPHFDPKYAIVRISKKNEGTVINIINCFPNWRHVIYDSLSTEINKEIGDRTWNGMMNAPEQDTVILIRGKCRMGKNLEKRHILFVMETAKNSNTDTVLQGLLGRVCGYSPGSKDIDVYLHDKIIKSGELQRYIELTEGQEIIPSKARNLSKTTIIKSKHPIVPFMVSNVVSTVRQQKLTNTQIKRIICNQVLNPNFDFKQTNQEQFQEIKEKFKKFSENNYKQNSKIEVVVHDVSFNSKQDVRFPNAYKKWDDLSKKIQYFITTQDNIPITLWHTGIKEKDKEEGRIINVFYYRDKEHKYGIPAGSAFIYGVTEKTNIMYTSTTNIPKTTLKEVFAHNLENGTSIVSNGGFVIHLPSDTYRNVELMHEYIVRFVQLSIEFPDTRCISSQWDKNLREFKGIIMDANVKNALLPGGVIFRDVFELGFNLHLTESDGPVQKVITSSGCFKYASISW